VGVADVLSRARTEYRWGAAAEGYQPRSDYYMALYWRKDAFAAASQKTDPAPGAH
jgi:hypothetical protein